MPAVYRPEFVDSYNGSIRSNSSRVPFLQSKHLRESGMFRAIQGLCHAVSDHIGRLLVGELNIAFLNLLTNIVVLNINVLRTLMELRVFGQS